MRAIDLILAKLTEDSYYSQYMNTPFSYAGVVIFTEYLSPIMFLLCSEKFVLIRYFFIFIW